MHESTRRNVEPDVRAVLSPLRIAAGEYERIATRGLPAVPIPGARALGERAGSWDGLRAALHDPQLPAPVVDEIWVWLIGRSRTHGHDATLMCVALAVPMLARVAGRFTAPADPYRADIESEVLTAFLTAVAGVEVDRPGVWHRLRWAARNAARNAARQHDAITAALTTGDHDSDQVTDSPPAWSAVPGHPETVLARAVAAGVLTEAAAELILLTRWEHRRITDLAAEQGVSHTALLQRRWRAETRLVAWLVERTHTAATTSPTEVDALDTTTGHRHPVATVTHIHPATDEPEERACA